MSLQSPVTFDEASEAQDALELAKIELEAKKQVEIEKAAAVVEYDHLDRLSQNQDYVWLLERHLIPMLKTEHDLAIDVGLTSAQREIHVQRHHQANAMLILLQVEHERLRQLLAQ